MSLDVWLTEEVKCENCSHCVDNRDVFDYNITHNLSRMAKEAGLYDAMWSPESKNYSKAKHLIKPLKNGIDKLVSDPAKYKEFNSANGWGLYPHLLDFARAYLEACETYPESKISTSS